MITDVSASGSLVLTAGILVGVAVAAAAWRRQALTRDGAVAAVVIGVASAFAGIGWVALLISYFAIGTALSRAGGVAKARRTLGIVGKSGARDAWQVIANGGVFGLLAVIYAVSPSALVQVAAAGALAASAADTWATEIGTWLGGTPRHVLTWQPIGTGMSGGVTVAGTLALCAGGCTVAALSWLVGWSDAAAVAVALGGIAGAMADTLLGASAQQVRYCPSCAIDTEQAIHACGTPTTRRRGASWVGNDAVNAAATLVGALVSGIAHWWGVSGWSAG